MPGGTSGEAADRVCFAVSSLQSNLPVETGWVEAIAGQVLRLQGVATADVSIVIVDDAAIRVINARHLGHDWATDVVSFAFGHVGDEDFGGELVVSAETAAREAALRQVTPRDELALYVVHGLLHLCGFDDQTEADSRAMRGREAIVLRELGIQNPFGHEFVGSDTVE